MQKQYLVRGFYPDSPTEIERLNLMYYHPDVAHAKGYWKSDFYSEAISLIENEHGVHNTSHKFDRKLSDLSYAIADTSDKLVGWIWFYLDKKHPLPTKIKDKYLVNSDNARFYEVSYEKLLSQGWPVQLMQELKHNTTTELYMERKGVIVEGLKLAIMELGQVFDFEYQNTKKLVIYAYVKPDNIASIKVLEKNGFEKQARMYKYNLEYHELWVLIKGNSVV